LSQEFPGEVLEGPFSDGNGVGVIVLHLLRGVGGLLAPASSDYIIKRQRSLPEEVVDELSGWERAETFENLMRGGGGSFR
jgi:hypothetical protein